jgi:uncharacterized repeat protein (TIGR01451 family)
MQTYMKVRYRGYFFLYMCSMAERERRATDMKLLKRTPLIRVFLLAGLLLTLHSVTNPAFAANADLALTKTASPDPAPAGGDMRYTLLVTNNGPDTATGVIVTDVLPGSITFMSASPSQGTCSGTTTVTCSLGTIMNSMTASVEILVVTSGTGTITNSASVTSDASDPVPGNNSATLDTSVVTGTATGVPLTPYRRINGFVNSTVTGGTLRSQANTGNACLVNASSAAVLSGIPATATVVVAYLYWAGSGATVDSQITLDAAPLTADRTFQARYILGGTNYDFFSGVKDVTAQVQAKRNNSYSFGGLTVSTGAPWCGSQAVVAGWSMIVVYADASTQPARSIVLYDGFDIMRNSASTYTLTGIYATPPPDGKATYLAWEGDPDISDAGEYVAMNGTNLSDASNPVNNPWNSTINTLGVSTSYGVDLDTFDVSSTINARDTVATTTVSTGADLVILSAVLLQVKTDLIVGKVFEDVNYGGGAGRSLAGSSGVARPGTVVELYDAAGIFLRSTTTDANGQYAFAGLPDGDYTVRVVNSSVTSSRTGYVAGLLPVQTYRTNASTGTAVAVTNEVGGANPTLQDSAANSTNANLSSFFSQSKTPVKINNAVSVSGVDFGFNFDSVVSTKDAGQGSLRQFLTNANALSNTGLAQAGRTAGIENAIFMLADGTDNYAGMNSGYASQFVGGAVSPVATFAPISALPTITDPVVLNGQTQPGWWSAPILELNGSGAGAGVSGLTITAGGSTIRGFTINRFTGNGISLQTNGTNTIAGNYIGLNTGGTASAANGGSGIDVRTANSLIGGTGSNDGNVVSGNAIAGVYLNGAGATTNTLQGNFIGTNATGMAAVPNTQDGIWIDNAPSNTIGGAAAGARNVISGNGWSGVSVTGASATGNVFKGNYIGIDAAGSVGVPNGRHGIWLQGPSTSTVGGTAAGEANVIAFNTLNGVTITAGSGHLISGNSIYSNGGLGIDLGNNGVTANDDLKPAGQPNLYMDFPVFTSASLSGATLTLAGYVGTATGRVLFATTRVEIFKSSIDASGYGEGQTYLGFVTTGANGTISNTLAVTGLAPGDRITGTATDGSNNTSEFGPNFTVTAGAGRCPGFTVTKTADDATSGSGSLRDCISAGNATSGATITVPAGTYTLTINGQGENANATGDLDITAGMTIVGAGADVTIIDGGGNDRVFDVRVNAAVMLSNLTIRNGNPGAGNDGGGVANSTGPLTLTNVTISGNTARDGAGIYNNSGTVTLTNVTVSGNTATRNGGGIYTNSGSVALINVTVSGNSAVTSGGGLRNQSANGTTLTNVTIANNSAGTGGGIYRNGGTVTLKNTIVANSTSGGNCSGTITSAGYNLDSANTCVFTQPGDKINTNPLLGPLQFNGGATFTHALLKGSPAIDAIVVSNGYPATDQRGVTRPQDGLNTGIAFADIGAFEYQYTPTAVTLKSFIATVTDTGVLLRWRTGTEVRNLGFHLYREEAGQRLRITPSLIGGSAFLTGPTTQLPAGHTYTWADPGGMAGSPYWLEDVDLNGTRTWHGPVYAVWSPESLRLRARGAAASALLRHLGPPPAPTGGPSPVLPGAPLGPPRWAEARAERPEATPARLQTQWTLAAGPAVKLAVTHEGWYRVPQPALLAAGLDPHVDVRTLQLVVDGEEQPLFLSGGALRHLGPADAIEFYGVGLDTPWTDTRTYWLTWGQRPGRRVPASTLLRVGSPASPASFPFTVERQDRVLYVAALLNGEASNFFGPVLTAEPVTQALSLPHLDPAAPGDAELEVRVQGLTLGPHRVRIALNGIEVGTLTFADQTQGVYRTPLAPSQLREGANPVTLVTEGDELDVSAVDTVRLTYWHLYTADDDQLKCTVPGGQQVTLAGFSSPRIGVVDITDPQAPQRLRGTVQPRGGAFALTVTAPDAGERTLLAFVEDRAPAPAVTAHAPTTWHQPGHRADLVILTPSVFQESARPLQALHEGQGLKVALVNVEDVYALFSFGAKDPAALRAFLQRAHAGWQRPPRFVLFLGGASLDPKNYLGFGALDFVPTKLVDTQLLETASDDWFADFTGSGVPQLALGRLPVRSAAEATAVIQKLVTAAQAAPSGSGSTTAVLVADTNDAIDFETASTQAAGWLPRGLSVARIDVGQLGFNAARNTLLDQLDRGPRLVHYLGHGSVEVWDGDGLLTAADADTLTNGTQLPLVVAMTCLNGFFHDPGTESLAAALLTAPTGGAVAVWASSGLTDPTGQAPLDRAFLQALGAGTEVRLGEAARAAKAATADPDVRRTWIFFGDPALRWVAPPIH